MSEYQYYEFAAIERPLTRAEMAQLRAVSTRAVITSTGFSNHYEWGDLKADPLDWMRRYFDAFVHTANWCSCRLALRVPLATFSIVEMRPFALEQSLTVEASDSHWIIQWFLNESEDYDRFNAEDGRGWMWRLAPLRDELQRGDLRSLYLGWLAGAACGELDDDVLEPEVPPGLASLSSAQQALVEFLEIDPDMLAAAVAGSDKLAQADVASADALDAWWGTWSRDEMVSTLRLLAQGQGQQAERQVKTRYAAWLKAQRPAVAATAPRRSVAELCELAEAAAEIWLQQEARQRALQEAEQRHQRELHLRQLMEDAETHWDAVEAQAQHGSGASYAKAVQLLAELAQAYALTQTRTAFDQALRRFLTRHANRGALLRRLTEAGLWSK
ncbi:hypothetical protein AAFF27_05725 [Xylophilus sp. GW821-FHT01B05]